MTAASSETDFAISAHKSWGVIENNVFESAGTGVVIGGGPAGALDEKLRIVDNEFIDGGIGILDPATGGEGVASIRRNEFLGTDQAVCIENEEAAHKIKRNLFDDVNVAIEASGANTIANNVIDNASWDGVLLRGGHSKVVHNTFINAVNAAVRCEVTSWVDTSLVANNVFLGNGVGFDGGVACATELLNNAAYDNASGNYVGTYVDGGGNLDGVHFSLTPTYAPSTFASPLVGAAIRVGLVLDVDHYGESRGNPADIGAVESDGKLLPL